MQAVYKLMAGEVNQDFIKSVQALFNGQAITITVDNMMDETTYLSSDAANLEHLTENASSEHKKYFIGEDFRSFVNESLGEAK